jgi:hypothetical protein
MIPIEAINRQENQGMTKQNFNSPHARPRLVAVMRICGRGAIEAAQDSDGGW